MRAKYIWDKAASDWVPANRYARANAGGGVAIMSDIQTYQAVAVDIATGKAPVIGSRSQHREFLKRNGYVEVGNEKPVARRMPGDYLSSPRPEIVEAFKRVTGRP